MNYDGTVKNLNKHGFIASLYEKREEALKFLLSIIPSDATVGFGGSQTVIELGLPELLISRGNTVYHRSYTKLDAEEIYKLSATADFYIASANALTEEGELINIDGRGNRVSAMIYGAKNVIFVAGTNKITKDIASGIERTRNISGPKNCVRLNKKTPCAITGKCERCNSPDTICRATVIHHHPTVAQKAFVVLINETLGY